jgi:hypothetical protein
MLRALPEIALATGAMMPALGLGTWRMGARKAERAREVAALQLGLSLGLKLIDTAERLFAECPAHGHPLGMPRMRSATRLRWTARFPPRSELQGLCWWTTSEVGKPLKSAEA